MYTEAWDWISKKAKNTVVDEHYYMEYVIIDYKMYKNNIKYNLYYLRICYKYAIMSEKFNLEDIMVFSSVIFIFIFLPITLFLYYISKKILEILYYL